MGGLHRQAEYGNVVEVIADFTHHLADPGVAVVAVLAQELAKIIQHQLLYSGLAKLVRLDKQGHRAARISSYAETRLIDPLLS